MPLSFVSDQQMVLMIASKNIDDYNETDYRFAKLIGEILATKLSQLILLDKIGKKNTELESAYEEISERNVEIELQQQALMSQSLELQRMYSEIKNLNTGLEKIVEERTQKLKEAHYELHTLFYRTSHDFRRPLTSILGLVNIATHGVQDEQTLQVLNHIQSTVHDLDKMLKKLQVISFRESESPMIKKLEFTSILEGLHEKIEPFLQERKVDFQYEVSVGHAYVADAYIITALLENLIENAVYFSKGSQPYVNVQVFENTKYLCLKVSDNGQGIKEELQPRIFEMYFRGNEASSGNGLGLYVVKKLVEKQRSILKFRSTIDKGSEFEIQLPLERAE